MVTVTPHDERLAAALIEARSAARHMAPGAPAAEIIRKAELEALCHIYLPDATSAEKTALSDLQFVLRSQRRRLTHLVAAEVIDEAEFAAASRKEGEWCYRQCAALLGVERFELLFGLQPTQAATAFDEPVAAALMQRYKPSAAERESVLAIWRALDPQALDTIAHATWPRSPRLRQASREIAEAEKLYRSGAVEQSIESARNVVAAALDQPRVGDAWMYFAAWALHIQGRGYEALMHLDSATSQYESSLEIKMQLREWLPAAAQVATEVKLGSIEAAHTPVQAITRLTRVVDALRSQRKHFADNRRIYDNLLEDSQLKLAEAYLEIGRGADAATHALEALSRARSLTDTPGEIQVLFVLFRAQALRRDDFESRLRALLEHDQGSATHPHVVRVLKEIQGIPVGGF